jgi:glutathione peroxidase
MSKMNIYDFKFDDAFGFERDLSEYKGKVLLIVNTASKCGFTPQYEGLEKLNKAYSEKGLQIVGFPCNQFGNQEPGTNEEIQKFCEVNYGVSFPIFAKIDVNGKNTHPLYELLKSKAHGLIGSKAIKWNFTKFLIDREGNIIKRFASAKEPEKLTADIEKLL